MHDDASHVSAEGAANGRADEALRRSETQFQLLVQGVADYAIYMLDPRGRVSSWNSGAERIKGYRPDEIIGSHFSHFYTDEDRAAGVPDRNLSVVVETGRIEAEGWRVRKDGSRFWAHVIIDRIRDDAGHLIGFAKITRDVTDRREAERQLEEAREALFQSQKMEAIGQLTGGMAHDFNNLLMAIQGALELLRKRLPDDERTQTIFNAALAGISRGANLTQRMLAFARRQELRPVPVDLAGLVYGMADLLQSTVGSHIHLSSRFPLGLKRVLVDPHQLELALLNLVVNARDAMPSGGTITIEAHAEEFLAEQSTGLAPGVYVCLAVADEGAGMDAATLARATDPFFTTKGVGKGTGLGLSMVHGLAAQSRGRLLLNSTEGEGTRVEIWLPAFTPGEHESEAEVASASTSAPSTGQSAGLRILAVDDDALVRVTMCAQLEDLGHVVTAAASGEQAMEFFQHGSDFDLLLTDYAMPGMTGSELAKAVRDIRPDFPVVIATGFAEVPIEGAFPLVRLNKPFDRSHLVDALSRASSSPGTPLH